MQINSMHVMQLHKVMKPSKMYTHAFLQLTAALESIWQAAGNQFASMQHDSTL